jgi:50S ribosomal protein L16 3-hydroxylase
MNIHQILPLLGGMSAADFMRDYWHKKPLLIRQAIPGFTPLLSRAELLQWAEQDDVESRLVQQKASWTIKQGPLSRKQLPPLKQPGWTVLVQGVDLLHEGAHRLLQQFRFVPDARLDDLMISYATDGGGVGPHFDSYDVFLLQAQGKRHWRIGAQTDLRLLPDVPLKILANFTPEQEFVLEPGDMLYLPPRYAHDGVAQGECMTYSIGFRAPSQEELQREILQRLVESESRAPVLCYQDPDQAAVEQSASIPASLQQFSVAAVQAALQDPHAIARALGEYLTEPKAQVWFVPPEEPEQPEVFTNYVLDRKTRMLFDAQHIFINGESFIASGDDAALLHGLANQRTLQAAAYRQLSAQAQEVLLQWHEDGWAQYV